MTVLVDTGASHSFVNTLGAAQIRLSDFTARGGSGTHSAVGIGGKRTAADLEVLGSLQLTGEVEQGFIMDTSWFRVMDFPLPFDLILGADWIRRKGAMIDLSDGYVLLGTERVAISFLDGALLDPDNDAVVATVKLDAPATFDASADGATASTPRWDALLHEFAETFQPPSGMPQHEFEHRLRLSSDQPTTTHGRRLSAEEEATVEASVREFLDNGWIVPSESPYSAGLVLARKKDGTLRLCWDYRRLNAITIKDAFPMRSVDELLDKVGGASWFTTLDLANGYHQIAVAPHDQHKTAFITSSGHYQWRVMPFGLTNAPATFQRMINDVLKEAIDEGYAVAYIDDVLIFSRTEEEHIRHVRRVLELLQQHGLRCKRGKCRFGQTGTEYLGHYVSAQGVRPLRDKVEAIREWPQPRTVAEVRRFLGKVGYYRKFIESFGVIARPLVNLTIAPRSPAGPLPKACSPTERERIIQARHQRNLKSRAAFESTNVEHRWNEACTAAFETLRTCLISEPVLRVADTRPNAGRFFVETDASGEGIGAVLTQRDTAGDRHPVEYFSRVLTPAEKNYSIFDRELMAVMEACKRWRHILEGRDFTLYTDQEAIKYLTEQVGRATSARGHRFPYATSRSVSTTPVSKPTSIWECHVSPAPFRHVVFFLAGPFPTAAGPLVGALPSPVPDGRAFARRGQRHGRFLIAPARAAPVPSPVRVGHRTGHSGRYGRCCGDGHGSSRG